MGQLARFAKPIIDEKAPKPVVLQPGGVDEAAGHGQALPALGDDLSQRSTSHHHVGCGLSLGVV